MKAKLTFVAISILMLQSSWTSPKLSKSNLVEAKLGISNTNLPPEFSFFRTHRQGRFGITSTWGLNSETGVQGYSLERTYEDPGDQYANWEFVSTLPCSNGRSYKFTDGNVFPGFISYRVKVLMINGGEMVSPVSTVHIVSH